LPALLSGSRLTAGCGGGAGAGAAAAAKLLPPSAPLSSPARSPKILAPSAVLGDASGDGLAASGADPGPSAFLRLDGGEEMAAVGKHEGERGERGQRGQPDGHHEAAPRARQPARNGAHRWRPWGRCRALAGPPDRPACSRASPPAPPARSGRWRSWRATCGSWPRARARRRSPPCAHASTQPSLTHGRGWLAGASRLPVETSVETVQTACTATSPYTHGGILGTRPGGGSPMRSAASFWAFLSRHEGLRSIER
jgi:hypothetical protein